MESIGPNRPNYAARDQRRRARGVWGKLNEVILDDILGEMGWMLVLVGSVALTVGLVWVLAQLFA